MTARDSMVPEYVRVQREEFKKRIADLDRDMQEIIKRNMKREHDAKVAPKDFWDVQKCQKKSHIYSNGWLGCVDMDGHVQEFPSEGDYDEYMREAIECTSKNKF